MDFFFIGTTANCYSACSIPQSLGVMVAVDVRTFEEPFDGNFDIF